MIVQLRGGPRKIRRLDHQRQLTIGLVKAGDPVAGGQRPRQRQPPKLSVGLRVPSARGAETTDAIRAAHRRVTCEDLFEALEIVERARRGEGGPDGVLGARMLLDRMWDDVVVLQNIQEDAYPSAALGDGSSPKIEQILRDLVSVGDIA